MKKKQHDLALQFYTKAEQDEAVVERVIDDESIGDELIGFHCQQAVEKLLKAALSDVSIEFRYTHDIGELIDLLADNGITLPEDLAELDILTPFAVAFRYDFLPPEPSFPYDRRKIFELVKKLRMWVEERLKHDRRS